MVNQCVTGGALLVMSRLRPGSFVIPRARVRGGVLASGFPHATLSQPRAEPTVRIVHQL